MPAAVTDIVHVGLAVVDLAAEVEFFTARWGLQPVHEHDGCVYLAAAGSTHPYTVRLRASAQRMTDLFGLSAASRADVHVLHAQVEAAGARIIQPPAPSDRFGGGYGFRFFDPDGHAVEVLTEATARTPQPVGDTDPIPLRISHMVLHSPQHKQLERFYREALGFRLSDWLGDFMVFLRCNRAHHRLAILPGPPALNHVAFDVASVDALMRGLGRLSAAGVELQWGPGRHTAGNNTFTYYSTPNGNTVEYTSDLEDVDESTWQPTVYTPSPETMDQWGTGRIIPGNRPHAELAADKGLWQVPA